MTLNADLSKRLEFSQITSETKAKMRELWALIEGDLDEILGSFYSNISVYPELAEIIKGKDAHLKSAQKKHWSRLFSGSFDEEYLESVNRIGIAHNRNNLEASWIIAGYQIILNDISMRIIHKFKYSYRKTAGFIKALNKAVLVDMEMVTLAQIEDRQRMQAEAIEKKEEIIQKFQQSISKVVTKVDHESERMGKTSQVMIEASTTADQEATEATSACEIAAQNIQSVAGSSQELTVAITEISTQLAGATDTVHRANEKANRSSQAIQNLVESANKIGNVISLIQDIAEQTNLLALNATIEAARAGESGRGFAVVAQEVKALAAQTGNATGEIAKQISGIQNETSQTVEGIEQIAEIMHEIDHITSAIAAAIDQQNATISHIMENVQHAADSSAQLRQNFGSVRDAVITSKESASDFQAVSDSMTQQSMQLTSDVKTFLEDIRMQETG